MSMPREELRKSTRTKNVYYYVDSNNNIDIKVREVFKAKKKQIHYPFNTRSGRQKYSNIKKITYDGLPSTLPPGFIKNPSRGYGFTRELSPVLYNIQDNYPDINHIIVSSRLNTSFKNKKTIIFNYSDLQYFRNVISPMLKRHSEETKVLSSNLLFNCLPNKFEKQEEGYTKNSLKEFIFRYDIKADDLCIGSVENGVFEHMI